MVTSAHDLFDPARHEPITTTPWTEAAARQAVAHIGAAAEAEFDEVEGSWLMHPLDDPPHAGARSVNFYWGAAGGVWALRHLAAQGAVTLNRDYTRWIERYPERVRHEAAAEAHGSASYLFGESAPLLLAWQVTQRAEFADRLFAVVQGNLHNPAHEPLWGNAGTVLAAIAMAEGTGHASHASHTSHTSQGRWFELVQQAVQALLQDMITDPDSGTWTWQQDLYGQRTRYLGAGHGLAGNVFPALRAAAFLPPALSEELLTRAMVTLTATALRAPYDGDEGICELINWHALADKERVAAWQARGGKPLVQDCHGAPGIVCRLANAPRSAEWDALLRGAGETTWRAGPLAKGPSLCHGTAGSALACLKLWRRFAEPVWRERARQLAMHAAGQVQAARAVHGQGRHSLWTGDLGVACVLWASLTGDARFPTLDHF